MSLSVKKRAGLGFGIVRKVKGKELWFFYAYKTQEQAETIMAKLTTPQEIEVNVSNPEPMKLVE